MSNSTASSLISNNAHEIAKAQKFKVSGVYKITCIPTGKFYIGSSIKVASRWRSHLWSFKTGRGVNPYFYKAWLKYGKESFFFEVIEITPPNGTRDREQHYLDLLRPWDHEVGYNNWKYATSDDLCGRRIVGVTRKTKRWIVTHPDGREEEILGMKKFCLENDLQIGALNLVTTGRASHHKGFLCRRADTSKEEWQCLQDRRLAASKASRVASGQFQKTALKKSRSFVITHPGGREESIIGLSQFCTANGLDSAAMGRIAQCTAYAHKGFSCRYAEMPKDEWKRRTSEKREKNKQWQTYEMVSPSGETFLVKNMTRFCREQGLTLDIMYRVAAGRERIHKGWTCHKA